MLAGNLREFSSGRKYKIPNIHEFANAMVGIEFLGIIEKIDSAISQRLDGEFFSPLGQYADHGNQKFRYLLGFTESFHSLDLSDQEVSSITDGVSEKPRGNVKKRGNKAFVAHISREAERKRKVLDYEWLSILSAISDIAGRDVPKLVSKKRLDNAFNAAYRVFDPASKNRNHKHGGERIPGRPKSNRSGGTSPRAMPEKGAIYTNPDNSAQRYQFGQKGKRPKWFAELLEKGFDFGSIKVKR